MSSKKKSFGNPRPNVGKSNSSLKTANKNKSGSSKKSAAALAVQDLFDSGSDTEDAVVVASPPPARASKKRVRVFPDTDVSFFFICTNRIKC